MTSYDPAFIQRFADRLYARAVTTAISSTVLGLLIGFLLAPMLLQNLPPALSTRCPDWLVAVLLGVIGLMQGLERGFVLRLQAQTALCQMEIERNTRADAAPGDTR